MYTPVVYIFSRQKWNFLQESSQKISDCRGVEKFLV